jgi:hypothetical protein
MTNNIGSLTRHDLETKIVKRCWDSEQFCREFTADPTGTFVKYLQVPGESLPKIVVHEETPGSWHIVLPAKPGNANELSEQELEKVAGGVTPTIVVSTVSTAMITAIGSAMTTIAVSIGEGGW